MLPTSTQERSEGSRMEPELWGAQGLCGLLSSSHPYLTKQRVWSRSSALPGPAAWSRGGSFPSLDLGFLPKKSWCCLIGSGCWAPGQSDGRRERPRKCLPRSSAGAPAGPSPTHPAAPVSAPCCWLPAPGPDPVPPWLRALPSCTPCCPWAKSRL